MDKQQNTQTFKQLVAIYIALAVVLVLAVVFINPLQNIVKASIVLVFAGITAYFVHIYSNFVRKCTAEYDQMKLEITRQQMIAKRKARLAAYFDRVLKDAADMIFTLDVDGFLLKFNTGAETILGYNQQEIVGRPFTELLVNSSDSAAIFDIVLQNDRLQNHEIKMKTKVGQVLEVSMSISEMRDEKNQILGMVATCKDITENKRLQQQLIEKNRLLEELAITDNLSGLFNVRHFHNEMTKAFTRMRRNLYTTLTLLLIDIDHFKQLNDTEGHQAGDEVIEYVGAIIKLCIRKDLDSGYRYGGDEFVVILLDTDAKNATVVADRIIAKFNEKKFGSTSLSIGVTTTTTDDDEEKLVHRADAAMYVAKRSGGNRWNIAETHDTSEIKRPESAK
ncbi:MAG: diguanylate cyclase [Fibrobacteres bacterium]|nr:diguanylate cyclase [Fibrobacterota bacterium]